ALLGAVGQAVIATDLDRKVIYWNGAAEALYGWSREDVLDRSVDELALATHTREQTEAIFASLTAGDPWSGDVPVRRKDGTTLLALVSTSPLLDTEGHASGFVGVSSDISHLAQVERDLRERVKELALLVRAGRIMHRHDLPVRERLRLLVDSMPAAWLYPDVTEARIAFEGEAVATRGFRETPWMLTAPIPSAVDASGRVEVALMEERPDLGDGPFLDEERELIVTLGRTIGEALERGRLTRLMEQTFSSLEEAVLIIDSAHRGRLIRDANPAARRIFGWSRDELVGQTAEILHVDRAEFERFAAEGNGELERTGALHMRFPMRRKDGTVFQAEQTVTLLDPEQGLDGGAVKVIRDVSARLAAEAALRRTEERFRVLSREISDVFCVIDAAGTILYASPSVEMAAGYSVEKFEGTNVLDVVHPEDRAPVQEMLGQVLATDGETVRGAYRIMTESGQTLHVESMARNLLAHPEIGGIVLSVRDVTERTVFEERLRLTQRLEAIGRLAGGIAHDFNNILTVIRSQADLVLLDIEDPRLIEDIGLIRASADRAAMLTGQLLAFSREQVLRPRVVDLGELLHVMGRMLDRIIGEDVRITYDVPEGVPPVEVDPGHLEQVLMNLAVNARDAMPDGGELQFAVREETLDAQAATALPGMGPGRYTTLSVTDTGTGMSHDVLERIFEPFFTTKGRGKGTGLGLAMAYGVMKQSGGGVHVESTLGEGSSFHLRFPVSAQNAEPLDHARLPSTSIVGAAGGTVLVVEDDHAVRRITQRILERAGFTVTAAENAETAVELLDQLESVDVLLTDLVLPGMSGRALVDHVMKTAPEIPIVVASGYDQVSPEHKGDLPREVDFLQKPFTTEALVAAIRNAIASKR
ncbi:MAG TPA: PAS domain S-box protein, partial [Candidatus Limnocylindrales bacterium]|nr:PAS domain S-box protein [Candidatus Limnocylindrales bacterium]